MVRRGNIDISITTVKNPTDDRRFVGGGGGIRAHGKTGTYVIMFFLPMFFLTAIPKWDGKRLLLLFFDSIFTYMFLYNLRTVSAA